MEEVLICEKCLKRHKIIDYKLTDFGRCRYCYVITICSKINRDKIEKVM